jgi:hypothetical protein
LDFLPPGMVGDDPGTGLKFDVSPTNLTNQHY